MISEFLEEHRHEPRQRRLELLEAEPPPTGDERWDVFLAALAERRGVMLARSELERA